MKTIKNLKIPQKLYVLIGIAVFGLLSVQSMSLFQMRNLNNVNHTIVENWLPSLSTARNMNTTMSNIRLNETVISTAEDKCKTFPRISGILKKRWTRWKDC